MGRTNRSAPVECERRETCPAAPGCTNAATPCVDLATAHSRKLDICNALESIADALPSHVDRLKCLQIANELVPLLLASHRYEEDNIFPAFQVGSPHAGADSISRLKTEHVEDECAAQDLTDILLAIGHGGGIHNPEALGFMLRAFFEALRRHVAFEREHVLPIAAQPFAMPNGDEPA